MEEKITLCGDNCIECPRYNAHSDEKLRDVAEFWSARELALARDYTQWRKFQKVIQRALIACENSGHNVLDDFAEVSKIVEAGATKNLSLVCTISEGNQYGKKER